MIVYAFYFLSFLAVMSALVVVFSRNPIYSVIFLVITFFCIACHYMLLNAQFLAAVHVIVYAGAIMVLFLYVIMLLNLNEEAEPQKNMLMKIAASVTGGLLMVILTGAIKVAGTAVITPETTANIGMIKNLGKILLSDFLLPFEAVSILLLAAMVGAVMLGKTHRKKKQQEVTGKNNKKAESVMNTTKIEEVNYE